MEYSINVYYYHACDATAPRRLLVRSNSQYNFRNKHTRTYPTKLFDARYLRSSADNDSIHEAQSYGVRVFATFRLDGGVLPT